MPIVKVFLWSVTLICDLKNGLDLEDWKVLPQGIHMWNMKALSFIIKSYGHCLSLLRANRQGKNYKPRIYLCEGIITYMYGGVPVAQFYSTCL